MRRRKTGEETRNEATTEWKIPGTKGKSNSCYFLHPTEFGKFWFCLYWLQKRHVYAMRVSSAFNFSVWVLTPEVNFSKSHKIWESWKTACLEWWLWPVPCAQDLKLDLKIPEEMDVVILWLKATPSRFVSRLLWHVSECRWQCLLSLCWCWLGLRLGDTPRVCQLLLALGRQSRLSHSTGTLLCSGKFNLTWHPLLCERERSQTVHTRELRHAINRSPSANW